VAEPDLSGINLSKKRYPLLLGTCWFQERFQAWSLNQNFFHHNKSYDNTYQTEPKPEK